MRFFLAEQERVVSCIQHKLVKQVWCLLAQQFLFFDAYKAFERLAGISIDPSQITQFTARWNSNAS